MESIWALLIPLEVAVIYLAGSRLLGKMVAIGLGRSRRVRWVLWALLAPGVCLHEVSHAMVALILGGRVHRFVPFAPHYEEGSVRFGYVTFSETRGGVVGRALVGMAPLWLLPSLTYLLACSLLDSMQLGDPPLQVLSALSSSGLLAIPGLVLLISFSLAVLPSPEDHSSLPLALLAVLAGATLLGLLGFTVTVASLLLPLGFVGQLLAIPALISGLGWLVMTVRAS